MSPFDGQFHVWLVLPSMDSGQHWLWRLKINALNFNCCHIIHFKHSCCSVVECSTHNLKVEGSNPAEGEKKGKKYLVFWAAYNCQHGQTSANRTKPGPSFQL